jgi:hypothetical protein
MVSPKDQITTDCDGQPVSVGSRVRVLEVAPFLERDLPPHEWAELLTMRGEVFEVYEIDEYGNAWVEKWFDGPDETRSSHSLGLAPNEMRLA